MSDRQRASDFVGRALAEGRSRAEVRQALTDAGWPDSEIDRALAHWAEGGFTPPVPAPAPFVTARDAFLYGLTFFALSAVIVNVISLAFDLIDAALGDETLRRRDIAWSAAALLVFAPVFVLLDRRVRGAERGTPLRKVFGYAALFFAAIVLLLTAVAVVGLLFLGGLGTVIAAKAATVAVVAGLVWLYYRADLASDRA